MENKSRSALTHWGNISIFVLILFKNRDLISIIDKNGVMLRNQTFNYIAASYHIEIFWKCTAMLTWKKFFSPGNGIMYGVLFLNFSLLTILLIFFKTSIYFFENQRKKSHYDNSFLKNASVMWVVNSVTYDAPSLLYF